MKHTLWGMILVLLFAQGCAVNGPNMPKSCTERLEGVTWQLAIIDNDPVTLKNPATLKFDKGGKIGGFDGCNSYFGTAEWTDSQISFGPIGSTRRFCQGEAGRVERTMLSMFKGTRWWNFDAENRLVIFDDEHRLIFEPKVQKSGIRD